MGKIEPGSKPDAVAASLPQRERPMNDAKNGTALVVMGVSGSGKTTVAELLAKQLGWPFMEGDRLHPPANVEKMRQGIPLTDADRAPWLDRIGEELKSWAADGQVRRTDLLGAQARLSRSHPLGPA